MSVHVKKRVADEHEVTSLQRRRGKSIPRTKARWEHERSFERAQTFFALEHFDEIAEKRRLRANKYGADIWPLRKPEGRYEEMW